MHAILLSYTVHNLVLEQGRVVRAERRVRGDHDAFLGAEVDDLGLRAGGVQLDLVDGRDNLGGGQETLEVGNREVRYTYRGLGVSIIKLRQEI